MNFKKYFLVFFLFLFIFFAAVQVGAQEGACPQCPPEARGGLVPCGRNCDDPETPDNECRPCQLCHFFVMFERIVNFILRDIVPPLAVLMVAIGGFLYIYAGSNPDGAPAMITKAKQIFTSVAIALVIIYGAWLIVNTFFMIIGVARWEGIRDGWWQINCEIQDSVAPVSSTPTVSTEPSVPLPQEPPLLPSGNCPNGTIKGPGNLCYQSQAIANQYGDASDPLKLFLECMKNNLPENIGIISSISDSNIANQTCHVWDTGLYSDPCQHGQNSCHYGGTYCNGKSYAVDYGDENNQAKIRQAARTCSASGYLLEGNHIHISIGKQIGCGCDQGLVSP